ncbi:MAG: type I methionyl aminopeptidase [Acutalibacteraceae bacterium]|nr:type I methionyl aminopeptidase [Acutalibacteraceae bacterium]
MVVLKTTREIELMREAGRISAMALRIVGEHVKPGVSTYELDKIAYDYIISQNAKPGFLNYNGFPASACISINNQVIHGIPDKKTILKSGDIVSVDLGAVYEGYNGDNAATFACGEVSDEAKRLMEVTKESLYEGIKNALPGGRLGDISSAIQEYVESRGYSVVRDFVGHGVGARLHEDPEVPNFGKSGHGVRLVPGMTLAIEPMINLGKPGVRTLSNGWTVVTQDGKLSAHFEHSIAITKNGPLILTDADYCKEN